MADAPQWVKPGGKVEYVLRSVGRFLTPVGGTARNVDPTSRARPVMLRSLEPETLEVETAVTPDGGRVYRIRGTAVKEPGQYLDTWMSYHTPAGKNAPAAIPDGDGEADLLLEALEPRLQLGGIARPADHVLDDVLGELEVRRRAAPLGPVDVVHDRQRDGERPDLGEPDEIDP